MKVPHQSFPNASCNAVFYVVAVVTLHLQTRDTSLANEGVQLVQLRRTHTKPVLCYSLSCFTSALCDCEYVNFLKQCSHFSIKDRSVRLNKMQEPWLEQEIWF